MAKEEQEGIVKICKNTTTNNSKLGLLEWMELPRE
jgi:hypothetical protein